MFHMQLFLFFIFYLYVFCSLSVEYGHTSLFFFRNKNFVSWDGQCNLIALLTCLDALKEVKFSF